MKQKKYAWAKAFASGIKRFKPGKLYPVTGEGRMDAVYIKDNEGIERYCLKHHCSFLPKGVSWNFVEVAFDVGDRVEFAEGYGTHKAGDTGTVVHVELANEARNVALVGVRMDEGGSVTCFQHRLKKETKQDNTIVDCKEKDMEKEIKVGATVKLVKNTACSKHSVGDIGFVVGRHPDLPYCWLVEVDGYSSENRTYSYEVDLEVVADTLEVGDYVELMEDYSGCFKKGVRGFVCEAAMRKNLVGVDLDDGRKINGVYPHRLKKVQEESVATPSLEGLSRVQLRKVAREAKELLDTEVVTVYSCGGRKWGKKAIPETKYQMTYTLKNGVIIDQPVIKAYEG